MYTILTKTKKWKLNTTEIQNKGVIYIMENLENMLMTLGIIGIVVSIAFVALTIYFIILVFSYLSSGEKKNKLQIKLIQMQIEDLEYKRTIFYNNCVTYMNAQINKSADTSYKQSQSPTNE